MNKPHLTFDLARQLAHNIIVEYGANYKYEAPNSFGSCQYTEKKDGKLCASCFVGILLNRFGVSLTDLEYIDKHRGNSAKCTLSHNIHILGFTIEEKAASFLTRFQELQDDEVPWGECMTDAVSTACQSPDYITTQHASDCPYLLGEVIE